MHPLNGRPHLDLVKNYSQYPERDANYLANVENLDSAAGRIINFLVEKDLFDNTIIIFSSDNGSYRQASNGELKAIKSYIYEGGIRVPAIFHWQELRNDPNTIIDEAAGLVDIMPTVLDILDIKPSPEILSDGVSIFRLTERR
jgi:arylsulfatase A